MVNPVVTGLPELRDNIDKLSTEISGPSIKTALRAGANVIRDRAKANAIKLDDPSTPENISKNIVTSWGRKETQATGNMTMRVGIMGGAGRVRGERLKKGQVAVKGRNANTSNPGGDTRYWRMLEFGTKHMAARPFMRPAMNTSASQAFSTFATALERAINRNIKKAGK